MQKGKLIILEGIDGCGKSYQAPLLIENLIAQGYEAVGIREPPSADPVLGIPDFRKKIITELDKNDPNLREKEFQLLIEARKALYKKFVIPALERGTIVVSERGHDSSTAFQGYGRGMDLEKIRKVNKKAIFGRYADLTILFDMEPSVALKRKSEDQIDRFETEPMEFHQRVKMGYLKEALYDTENKIKLWQVIGADDDKNVITQKMLAAVKKHLGL